MSVIESSRTPTTGKNTDESSTSSVSSGANDWYCKSQGQEFGPLSFDELTEYVGQGHFDVIDDVKLGVSGVWRPMSSVGRLVTMISAQKLKQRFRQPSLSPPKPETASPPKPDSAVRSNPPAEAPRKLPAASEKPTPSAPQLKAQPVPVQPVPDKPVTVQPVQDKLVPAQTDIFSSNFAISAIQPAELVLIKAQAAFDAIEQAVTQLIGWTSSSTCSPQWWAVIGGEPVGPESFSKIFELVVSGRMLPTDFVRNGIYGQFSPVGNLPGVISAAIILRQAREAFELAKSNASQLAALTPIVTAKPPALAVASSEAISAVATTSGGKTPDVEKTESIQAKAQEQTKPEPAAQTMPRSTSVSPPQPLTASYSPNSGFSSSMANSSSMSSSTMATRPRPLMPSRSSSGPSFFERHSETLRGIGIYGSIAVVMFGLLFVGVKYLPIGAGTGADTRRYNELKQLLTEIRARREAKSTDFADIISKAEKLRNDFMPVLKSQSSPHYPAKQYLLWAVRDDLPNLMKESLTAESKAERVFNDRLDYVALHLKINNK